MTTAAATRETAPAGTTQRTSLRRVIAYALLIAWSLLMFVPFAWTVVTSLKDRPEALQVSLPANPDFEAWAYTAEQDPGCPI